MEINIMTKVQAKSFIEEEVERRTQRIYMEMSKLRQRILKIEETLRCLE
jgi:hypothetical protein